MITCVAINHSIVIFHMLLVLLDISFTNYRMFLGYSKAIRRLTITYANNIFSLSQSQMNRPSTILPSYDHKLKHLIGIYVGSTISMICVCGVLVTYLTLRFLFIILRVSIYICFIIYIYIRFNVFK